MAAMTTASDPRFLRSREAILAAARELLTSEGPVAVTHVRVAELSGVGRATVYRHWPRADAMLAEAMAAVPMPFFTAPAEPTREWLRQELTSIARQLEYDDVRAVATTLANSSMWDERMDERRQLFADTLRERLATALADAHSRGYVVLRGDPRAVAAHTIGPLYYRTTIERGMIDDALIEFSIESLGEWR